MSSYPDIEFVKTDPETVLTDLITLYEELTKRTLNPASPERLFISWIAAVIIQQRVIINETAKMNVPRYAKGEYLDSLAELFQGIQRLPASPAYTTVRCYISEAQSSAVIIPQGTRVSAGNNIVFATTEAVQVEAGNLYVDVNAECLTGGEVGNGFVPGQIKEIVDVYDYYQKIENITTSGGGADEESDAEFYERMRESMESFSTAGPINGYIYWTKSVSSAVADVAVVSPEPCEVDIRVILKNGQEPTEAILQEIEDALTASDVRPLTDNVTVSAPDTVDFTVDVTFYIPKNSSASATEIEAKVRAAIDKYCTWQQEKMGRDINPSYLTQLMMAAGAKRVVITEPQYAAIDEIEVGKLLSKTVTNGGLEDV